MKDSFNELMKVYKTKLSALTPKAWAMKAPAKPSGTYVVYTPITATPEETKTESGQIVFMQIKIIADNLGKSKASDVNDVAGEVYSVIYPDPDSKLTLNGMYLIGTFVEDDRTLTLPLGQYEQVQRIITFKHVISFNS